jgi:hypothetical protein
MRIVCDKCYKPISRLDPHSIEDAYGEVVCENCRQNMNEAAYEREQEKLMESGGLDDSTYRQDMKDAGRGHLIR